MSKQPKHAVGERFGAWVLTEFEGGNYWTARCDCGKEASVILSHLTSGKSLRCRACYGIAQRTHGRTNKDGTYASWSHMRGRCLNPNDDRFHQYGGAGVTIAPRWGSFENFLADMGDRPEGHSLDRKDAHGNYTPDNCRWATPKEQMNNLRNQKRYTHEGQTMTMTDWARAKNVHPGTLRARLRRGASFAAAISKCG